MRTERMSETSYSISTTTSTPLYALDLLVSTTRCAYQVEESLSHLPVLTDYAAGVQL